MDIGTTFQQYQKVEKCYNRIFAEQLVSICKNRGWKTEVVCEADPKETLKEWMDRDYGSFTLPREPMINNHVPDKVMKIRESWDKLDKTAQRNYYGEEPIPFVVDSIERGN